ncbi:hypothetical protein PR202_gb16161 [Eleusine coracana subsp. coracana]|uniref:J domain-containing protein n=1 Tax=Eleusine coracana subsp. coracana TaxID=191504 RepID=A0AAV5EXD9_ELECO|nr:hypothetical protein PR202_gb16161 [Eleusine coracana subsp. coracana]
MAAASTAARPFTPFLHGQRPRRRRVNVVVAAASTPDAEPKATGAEQGKKTVDTRIHWSDPDEGWIGGDAKKDSGRSGKKEPLGRSYADLMNSSSETHYELSSPSSCSYFSPSNLKILYINSSKINMALQPSLLNHDMTRCKQSRFLGINPKSDIEEIKAAYRRLSKEYHPDTTTLPLKTASEKFIRLREVYNVLSKEETRRFYDWTLAQEAESRRLQQLRSRLEDPYEQDLQNYESVPDMVDRLGGKNMKLSDQAMTALTFDIVIIFISFLSIIYALFFKEQY